MKTRIQIVEYNSGNKEYVAQKIITSVDTISNIITISLILGFLMGVIAYVISQNVIISSVSVVIISISISSKLISIAWRTIGIETTIEKAKELIDVELNKHKVETDAKKKAIYDAKIKKSTYVKYP